jgi:hypothetical protein
VNRKILSASILVMAFLAVLAAAYVIAVPATPDSSSIATSTAPASAAASSSLPVSVKPSPSPARPPALVDSAVTLALGAEATVAAVLIKPISVTEDSRCPAAVACAQAGTVKANVSLSTSAGTVSRQMQLGRPESIPGGQTVTMTAVAPAAIAGGVAKDENYRLTFRATES